MVKLMIVESPAKIAKIKGYLGQGWIVEASLGHIRDLPEDQVGINIHGEFAPDFKVRADHQRVVTRLKKAIESAEAIYLATDPDREGEAIAWHVMEVARAAIRNKPVYRVTFNAITKSAIQAAVAAPRKLDMKLVEAQIARRLVDRLVGYLISPLACKVLNGKYSAGRVQSVCLRLVVERERAIAAFVATKSWTLDAELKVAGQTFKARLTTVQGQKAELAQKQQVDKLIQGMTGAAFWVNTVKQAEKARRPLPPFTTSTLQQAASKALGFSPETTMQVAQKLYETGLITYMRTDSTAVAPEGQAAARQFITTTYGPTYVPPLPQVYETKSENAQEAHEAIRPTDIAQLAGSLPEGDGAKVYGLIWKRFIASQMADARYQMVLASIAAGRTLQHAYPVEFQAKGRTLIFDGFLRAYQEAVDDGEEVETEMPLPRLGAEMPLAFVGWCPEEHTTQAPPRYTEASLIQNLEQRGIGRPSTYASMVKIIKDKGYVRLEKKRLVPADTGLRLCDFLVGRFPAVFDFSYTATLEGELDDIITGKTGRVALLQAFWTNTLAEPLRVLSGEIRPAQPPQKGQPAVLTIKTPVAGK